MVFTTILLRFDSTAASKIGMYSILVLFSFCRSNEETIKGLANEMLVRVGFHAFRPTQAVPEKPRFK